MSDRRARAAPGSRREAPRHMDHLNRYLSRRKRITAGSEPQRGQEASVLQGRVGVFLAARERVRIAPAPEHPWIWSGPGK